MSRVCADRRARALYGTYSHGDRVIRTDTAAVTGFDNVMTVAGQSVKLTIDPSELVFLE
jgi:hypothetical protein